MREFLRFQKRIIDVAPNEYYFAYGANLSLERLNKNRIQFEEIGPAVLSELEIEFTMPCEYKGKGFASLSPQPSAETWGLLFKVSKPSLLMLDILEWVPFGSYKRISVSVTVGENTFENVWAYVAVNPTKGLKPSKGYLNAILREAERLRFPESYLKFLGQFESQTQFDLDPGFSLLIQTRRRLFEENLRGLYLIHDRIREYVAERIP